MRFSKRLNTFLIYNELCQHNVSIQTLHGSPVCTIYRLILC